MRTCNLPKSTMARPFERIKLSSDAAIGAVLGALPVPTLGALYVATSRANGASPDLKEREEYSRGRHFAAGAVPGTLAGIGGTIAATAVSNKALGLRAASALPAPIRRWAPLAIGGVAGGALEPSVTGWGANRYEQSLLKSSGKLRKPFSPGPQTFKSLKPVPPPGEPASLVPRGPLPRQINQAGIKRPWSEMTPRGSAVQGLSPSTFRARG